MRLPVKIWRELAFAWITVAAAQAFAQTGTIDQVLDLDPDLANGKKIYHLCAACHSEDGYGGLEGEFPSIAGQHQRVMLKQLFDIQSKKRINPTMYPFSDLETLGGIQGMADVSAYVSSLPINPAPITGPVDTIETGAPLYHADCAVCHGRKGEGVNAAFYPLLRGQHYPYLVREITWIRDGFRKNANPAMVEVLKNYSDGDVAAVASYISNLQP